MNKKQREVILIFGKVGSGKSSLARKLAKKLSDRQGGKQVVVFDFNHEHDFNDSVIVTNAQEIERELDSEKFQFIIFRVDDDAEDTMHEIESAFKLCWQFGEVILFVDEADFFISARDNDVRKSYFLRCVQFGRHRQIDIIACARRVVELNIFVRAQVTRFITFRQTESRDLKRLEESGFDAEAVKNLGKYKFLSIQS